ncbi:MAG TPA: AAA family ATPase, partial [Thermoanaerobaculia bacterium]|nr:AAA family ATPase [Thermoanaerobaculia bacterium]
MTKQTRPRVFVPVRLLRRMDGIAAPVTWIAGPAGGGKTTLVRSWLDARKVPALWYTLEPNDADPATFFLYLGRAAGARRGAKPLPQFRPEYAARQALSRFARGFFEELARRLPKGAAFVLDGLEEISEGSPLQSVLASIAGWIPQRRVIVISRGDPPKAWARLRARRELALIGW